MAKTTKRPMTVVRLDAKLHRALKVEAARRGMSMSDLAAQALRVEFGRKPGA